MLNRWRLVFAAAALLAAVALLACSQAAPQPVEVTRVVEVQGQQVEVTRVVEMPGEQVEVTKIVEMTVDRPVEVTKIVERTVDRPVEVTKIVERMVEVAPPPGPKETIVFSDLNWTSAQVQNRVAQYIVEEGYGYPTDVKFGATLPLFQGLRTGDTHVTLEIWLPNQIEAWNEAIAGGEVVSVGKSLGNDWQSSFVIPAYLQEQYPELDSVEDLKEQQYKDLFKTAETGDKARLVACVIGWACEEVGAAQVAGYGLEDHVEIINAGDNAALNADMYGAWEKEEPWLGYTGAPTNPPWCSTWSAWVSLNTPTSAGSPPRPALTRMLQS